MTPGDLVLVDVAAPLWLDDTLDQRYTDEQHYDHDVNEEFIAFYCGKIFDSCNGNVTLAIIICPCGGIRFCRHNNVSSL